MSQKERYYTIESQSRFHVKFEEVKNLEDVADEFFGSEELIEMFGMTYVSTYCATVKRATVIELLSGLKADMIAAGKKSIIIEDAEFVEFVTTNDITMSDFVPGLRRVGNRLSIHVKKEQTTPNKRNVQHFLNVSLQQINKRDNLNMDLKYADQNYVGAIEIIQKLTTLAELIEFAGVHSKWFTQIWDNPSAFTKES